MKATLAVLLLLSGICFAGDTITTNETEGLITKVKERRDGNGNQHTSELVYRLPDAGISKYDEAKYRILLIVRHKNASGVTTTSRSYFVGGDTLLIESDEHGDGVKMILYHTGTGDMEEFTRHPDGSVTPVSTKTLAADKLEQAAFDKKIEEALHELFEGKTEKK